MKRRLIHVRLAILHYNYLFLEELLYMYDFVKTKILAAFTSAEVEHMSLNTRPRASHNYEQI